jgi:hypothetical protein
MAGGVTIPRKSLGESLGFSFVTKCVPEDFRNLRDVGIGCASESELRRDVAVGRKYVRRFVSAA